jgi:hypothetical protein
MGIPGAVSARADGGELFLTVSGALNMVTGKDEIKGAPKFDKDAYRDRTYRDRLAEYYRRFRY